MTIRPATLKNIIFGQNIRLIMDIIQVTELEFKLSQYADDTTAFVSDLKSVTNLFQLFSNFQECSGLEINKSKTEGLWLGANRNNT